MPWIRRLRVAIFSLIALRWHINGIDNVCSALAHVRRRYIAWQLQHGVYRKVDHSEILGCFFLGDRGIRGR